MHLARRADDGRNAIAAGRAHKHQQRAGNQRGRHHRQGDGEQRFQRRCAGHAAGLLQGGVHFLHGPGDRNERIRIIEGGQHPDEPAEGVDVNGADGVRRHAEDGAQEYVDVAHVGVEQAQPGHGAHIGRHHVRQHKQAAEELLAVQVGTAHQPRQGEGKQRAQYHGGRRGNQRVLQRAPVHGIGVQAREGFQGEAAVGEEGLDHQVDQRQQLEQKHEVDNQQNDHPLHVEMPAVIRPQQADEQDNVQGQQDTQHAHRAAPGHDKLRQPADAAGHGFPVGIQPGAGLADGLFQAVGQVGGNGLVGLAAAEQKQLQQHLLTLGALHALGGGSRRFGQGKGFIRQRQQQRPAERGPLGILHGRHQLFDFGGHLGAVHRKRNIKQPGCRAAPP